VIALVRGFTEGKKSQGRAVPILTLPLLPRPCGPRKEKDCALPGLWPQPAVLFGDCFPATQAFAYPKKRRIQK